MLATLVVNKLRGTLIAILTGGKAIAEDLGIKLENHKIDDMGKAKIAANAAGVIDPSKVVRSLQC